MATPEEVKKIHPSIRHTRLGNHINALAKESGVAGLLAKGILNQPHDQPLEITPIALLSDYMLENPEHPLSVGMNWDQIPTKLALDSIVRETVGNVMIGFNGYARLAELVRKELPENAYPEITKALSEIKTKFPEVSDNDIIESAQRNNMQRMRTKDYNYPEQTGTYDNSQAPSIQAFKDDISNPDHLMHEAEKFIRESTEGILLLLEND